MAYVELQNSPRMARYYTEYLAHREFPEAFPWKEQPARWQRTMLSISSLYQLHKDRVEADVRKRPPLI